MAYLKHFFVALAVAGVSAMQLPVYASHGNQAVLLDGGNSPGTYEPDPDDQRRGDDHGGPYNEPGSDNDRGRGSDHGGPYNEPGSDSGPYYSRPKF